MTLWKAHGITDFINIHDIVIHLAATEARRTNNSDGDSPFNLAELEWFSRNSYNLAVQHVSNWEPANIERLLRACISFIDLYPSDLQSDAAVDIKRREMLCLFLGTVLSMAQARAQNDVDDQVGRKENPCCLVAESSLTSFS